MVQTAQPRCGVGPWRRCASTAARRTRKGRTAAWGVGRCMDRILQVRSAGVVEAAWPASTLPTDGRHHEMDDRRCPHPSAPTRGGNRRGLVFVSRVMDARSIARLGGLMTLMVLMAACAGYAAAPSATPSAPAASPPDTPVTPRRASNRRAAARRPIGTAAGRRQARPAQAGAGRQRPSCARRPPGLGWTAPPSSSEQRGRAAWSRARSSTRSWWTGRVYSVTLPRAVVRRRSPASRSRSSVSPSSRSRTSPRARGRRRLGRNRAPVEVTVG